MEKGAKIGITITSIVVAGVGIYFLGRALKWWGPNKGSNGNGDTNGGNIIDNITSGGCSSGKYVTKACKEGKVLKKGDKCEAVAKLQSHLNNTDDIKLDIDGCWGSKTEAAATGKSGRFVVGTTEYVLYKNQLAYKPV